MFLSDIFSDTSFFLKGSNTRIRKTLTLERKLFTNGKVSPSLSRAAFLASSAISDHTPRNAYRQEMSAFTHKKKNMLNEPSKKIIEELAMSSLMQINWNPLSEFL